MTAINLYPPACILPTPAVLAAFGTSAAPLITPGTSPAAVAAGLALTGNRWGITPMGGGYALVDVAETRCPRFSDEVITESARPRPMPDCGRLPAVWWLRNYRGRSYPASGGRAVAYAAPPAAGAAGVGPSPPAVRAGGLGEALNSGTLPGAGMDISYGMGDTNAMKKDLEGIFHSSGFPDATAEVTSGAYEMDIRIHMGSSVVLRLKVEFRANLQLILTFIEENPQLFRPEYFEQVVPAILRLIGRMMANGGFKKLFFGFDGERQRGLSYILYTAFLEWSSVYFDGRKHTPADIVTAVNARYDRFERGLYGIFADSASVPSILQNTTSLRQFLTKTRHLLGTATFYLLMDRFLGAMYNESLYRNIPGINDLCIHPGIFYLLALLTMGDTYIEVPVESLTRSTDSHGQGSAAGDGDASGHVAVQRLPDKARRVAPPPTSMEFPDRAQLERYFDRYLSGARESDHVHIISTTSGHQILTHNPLLQLATYRGQPVELNVTEEGLRRILPAVRRLVEEGRHPLVAIVVYKEVRVTAASTGYKKFGVVHVTPSGMAVAFAVGHEVITSPLPEDGVDGGGVSLSISEVHRRELSDYYALSPPRRQLRLTYDTKMNDERYLALLLRDMAENGIMNTIVSVANPNGRLAGRMVEGLPGCGGNRIVWVRVEKCTCN